MGFLDRFKRKQPDLTPEEREASVKKAVAKLEEEAVVGRAKEVVKAAERKHKAEREAEKRNLDRINREIREEEKAFKAFERRGKEKLQAAEAKATRKKQLAEAKRIRKTATAKRKSTKARKVKSDVTALKKLKLQTATDKAELARLRLVKSKPAKKKAKPITRRAKRITPKTPKLRK